MLLVLSIVSAGCAASSTTPSPTTVTPTTFVMTWNNPAFPSTGLGATSTTPLVVTLWNNGAAAVPVTSVTDSNAGEFPWTTTCQLAGSLAPNSTCTVTTRFTPSAMGAQTATLTINANSTSQDLALSGTGAAVINPQVAINPASGSASTVFTLSVTAATPGGQLALNTIYTPAAGSPDIPFATTAWAADASGKLTVSATSDSPGLYENWFVDIASGLATNHIFHAVQ